MTTVYVDNFRGFSQTYLDLKDVNFLVGENSTGKTSLLAILKLLSTTEFWFGQDFNVSGALLGHFRDMVSASSADQSVFRIGLHDRARNRKSAGGVEETAFAVLLAFREERGLPYLAEFYYQVGNQRIQLDFGRRSTRYRSWQVSAEVTAEQARPEFERWPQEAGSSGTRFAPIPFSGPISPGRVPLPWALSEVERALKLPAIYHLPFRLPFGDSGYVWLATLRSKPRRTYDEYKVEFSSEGEHTPYLIKRILATKKEAAKFKTFMKSFGEESHLFEDVRIRRHGPGPTAPFELDVVLSSRSFGISSVGYGVSQSLPILVELFARTKGARFAIQQPEVHLHPRAQAALGETIFRLAAIESKIFFVETHSDFVIDRFRHTLERSTSQRKPTAQIVFFRRVPSGNEIVPMVLDEHGRLPDSQPEDYRSFFVREALDTLGLE